MLKQNALRTALACAIAATLSGCGGGGSTADDSSGVTLGRITGFGSVYVDGIRYHTDGAEILIEDSPSSESELQVGMIVTLTGSESRDGSSGTATRIVYRDDVEGVVTAVDPNNSRLTVLGQTVIYDGDTVFEAKQTGIASIAEIPVNAVVEVSGFPDAEGTIVATRIEMKAASFSGEKMEVKGIVRNLTATTLQIGGLTVDWSSANTPHGNPIEGQFVEVEGRSFNPSGHLVATKVEPENDGRYAVAGDGALFKIEGIVTGALVGDDFEVNGHAVRLVSTTRFEHGGRSDLVDGAGVEVKGVMNGTTLVASKVELKSRLGHGDRPELEGIVEAVDPDAGTLVLLGQQIRVDTSTLMEDDRDDVRRFNLSHLVAGVDRIEVRVVSDGSGGWLATKLERDDDRSPAAKVEGRIESTSGTTITIAQVTIELAAARTPIGFSPIVGQKVEVRGNYNTGTRILEATELERDD